MATNEIEEVDILGGEEDYRTGKITEDTPVALDPPIQREEDRKSGNQYNVNNAGNAIGEGIGKIGRGIGVAAANIPDATEEFGKGILKTLAESGLFIKDTGINIVDIAGDTAAGSADFVSSIVNGFVGYDKLKTDRLSEEGALDKMNEQSDKQTDVLLEWLDNDKNWFNNFKSLDETEAKEVIGALGEWFPVLLNGGKIVMVPVRQLKMAYTLKNRGMIGKFIYNNRKALTKFLGKKPVSSLIDMFTNKKTGFKNMKWADIKKALSVKPTTSKIPRWYDAKNNKFPNIKRPTKVAEDEVSGVIKGAAQGMQKGAKQLLTAAGKTFDDSVLKMDKMIASVMGGKTALAGLDPKTAKTVGSALIKLPAGALKGIAKAITFLPKQFNKSISGLRRYLKAGGITDGEMALTAAMIGAITKDEHDADEGNPYNPDDGNEGNEGVPDITTEPGEAIDEKKVEDENYDDLFNKGGLALPDGRLPHQVMKEELGVQWNEQTREALDGFLVNNGYALEGDKGSAIRNVGIAISVMDIKENKPDLYQQMTALMQQGAY